jgi:hypothetical protein
MVLQSNNPLVASRVWEGRRVVSRVQVAPTYPHDHLSLVMINDEHSGLKGLCHESSEMFDDRLCVFLTWNWVKAEVCFGCLLVVKRRMA